MIVHDKHRKEYSLRMVEINDAADIIAYMDQVIRESDNLVREPDEWTMTIEQEEAFIKRVLTSDHEYVCVLLDGQRIISVSGIHGSPLKRLQHRVNLGISVLKEYHNLGLGHILMNHLIEQARSMGKKSIDLEVRSDNHNAIHLYKSVGFVTEGIKHYGFYVKGTYVDLTIMAYHIKEETT